MLKLEDKTMDYNKAALEMHETHKGKVGIVSKVEVATRDDLSTAYTPGVAEPCRKIKENPDDVYKYTFKGNMVAVVSNGTAVLGLGDIGPEAGLPVMEGKAVLFKEFGGVDAFPICIDAHDAASVIAACKAIAPTFGGINLEDIKSPECFEIEETLERELDIPVFHDDQHGTAIVVTAALINALRVVGKKMEDVHIVLNGPGAAGTAIIKMLMTAGAKDIIAVDQFGTLYKGCNSAEAHKNWLGEVTNPRQIKGGLKEALAGAVQDDVHILHLLAHHTQGVDEGSGDYDGGAMLVIVEHGDVQLPLQGLLDLEAFRALDILQIDAAEGGGDGLARRNDAGGVVGVDADGEGVHPAELLEQHGLALHDGQPGFGADVAQTQHGGAVGHDGHHVALEGVLVHVVGVFLDLPAGLGHAGSVRGGQVVAGLDLHLAHDAHLAVVALVHFEGSFVVIHGGPPSG